MGILLPDWTWEFHGHRCPFMPMGYRMGSMAMKELGVERERDHGLFAFTEMGEGHPNTCMNDGIQSATGCTYGKLLIDRLNYGRLAFVLYKAGRGAVRVSVRPAFIDVVAAHEFSRLRKSGVQPSQIPPSVAEAAVALVLGASEGEMFRMERMPDFGVERTAVSFERAKCEKCGEYVFERYARLVGGKTMCIPCSGYASPRPGAPRGGL